MRWISASDVGRAAFCPKYLEIRQTGASVSRAALSAREAGDRAHERLNAESTKDNRCFAATYAYGANDPRTNLLRSFRDTQLNRFFLGRQFTQIYYRISPALVRCCRRSAMLDRWLKSALDWVVATLSARQEKG